MKIPNKTLYLSSYPLSWHLHLLPNLFDLKPKSGFSQFSSCFLFIGQYILNKFNLFQYSALAHMDPNAAIEEREGFRNGVELVKSVSDKHIDLLRPSARYYTTSKGQATDVADGEKGKYTLIRDPEDFQGIYDKPLPCFGCGIGWFSFLLGFVFPLMWYYGTFLYFGNYHRKDPRERAGLAAAAIAAMAFSVVLLVIAAYCSLF